MDAWPTKKNSGKATGTFHFWHCKSKVVILQERQEPLPWCDKCGMHMRAAILFKHRQSDKCYMLAERRLQERDVKMEARCGEMEFSLYGEEGEERVENVATFQYLG